MRTIKRYLLKLLVAAVIGAVLGALSAWLVLGHSVVLVAILGALVGAPLGTLYDSNVVVHSYPNSRGKLPRTTATLPTLATINTP
jgi:hypothetical protein